MMDNLMRGCRLGLFQNGLNELVQDLDLKSLHVVVGFPDDGLEVVVVGDLLERERPHLLKIELDSFDPGVNMLSIDEVLLGFNKVLVVKLFLFEPIAFVLAQQTEETVAQAL
jgi:hypothetical protein